jgi:hypothetical protein
VGGVPAQAMKAKEIERRTIFNMIAKLVEDEQKEAK